MIKLIYCFRKRADLSDEQFATYWRDVHGPIGASIPGLRRFVQSRAIRLPGDARPPDYDGVVELWFDDAEALQRARASDAWRRASADEPNFLDSSSTAYLVSEEHTVL